MAKVRAPKRGAKVGRRPSPGPMAFDPSGPMPSPEQMMPTGKGTAANRPSVRRAKKRGGK